MINIIAAMSHEGVLGLNGKLPWSLPADLQRFKELTLGNVVLMGRKTYESIDPPLRGRTIVVVTKQKDYKVVNGYSTNNLLQTIERYRNDNLFIAGGGDIYNQTIGLADRLYTTLVHKEISIKDTDEVVYFPEYKPEDWGMYYREGSDYFDHIIWNRMV